MPDVPTIVSGDRHRGAHRDGPRLDAHVQPSLTDDDADLVLFPEPSDSVNDYYWSHTDEPAKIADAWTGDCWVPPGGLVQTAAANRLRLPPGTTAAADFRVLAGPDGGCATSGRYRLEDSASLRSARTRDRVATLRFRVDLHVRADGTLAASGTMQVETPSR